MRGAANKRGSAGDLVFNTDLKTVLIIRLGGYRYRVNGRSATALTRRRHRLSLAVGCGASAPDTRNFWSEPDQVSLEALQKAYL